MNINLSDSDPINNSAFLRYRIIVPVTVTFTSINAFKNKCAIDVIFTAEREYDVLRYEIEISKNGINYSKIGMVGANQNINYKYNFVLTSLISATNIYIRIKSIDRDGKYQYSPIKTINGQCSEDLSITAYPNPLLANNECTVKAITGDFKGSYQIKLYDAIGKLI